jgi:hypothetical protein
LTWDKILRILTSNIYFEQSEDELEGELSAYIKASKFSDADVRVYLDDDFILQVRFQFEALGLMLFKFKNKGFGEFSLYWELTEKGRKYISRLNAVHRVAAKSAADTYSRDNNSVSSAKSQ